MRFLLYTLIVLTSLSFANKDELLAEELIKDPKLQKGFSVVKKDKRRTRSLTHVQPTQSLPIWTLAEWGSKKSILDNHQQQAGYIFNNKIHDEKGELIKAFGVVDHSKTSEEDNQRDFDFHMEVNGLAEFQGREKDRLYRKPGEWWPNFLLGQKLHSKTLRHYEQLILSLDAKLVSAEPNYQQGYNKHHHAGRFVVSVTLRDMFGRTYLWLNIPIYDDRYEFSPFGCEKCEGERCETIYRLEKNINWRCPIDAPKQNFDGAKAGTKKMMFRVGSKEFTDQPLEVGEWQSFSLDLMPYIEEASRTAQQLTADDKGIGKFTSFREFYFLGSINLGWEVSGLNHNAMQIRNLSLQTKLKQRPVDKIKQAFQSESAIED